MPIRWVLFDLNGTLLDPAVLAQPLGGSAAHEDLIDAALDTAVAEAMATTITGRHADFSMLLDAALWRALTLAGMDPALTGQAMALLGSMPAFLEVPGALERLRGEGMRLGVVTQTSTRAAEQVLRFAGLLDRLDLVLGADEVGVFKPHPRVYATALERIGVAAQDACMVAAHWWDVTGAARAGLRTGWVARRERVLLTTVPEPDVSGRDLTEVADGIVALA